MTGHQLKKPLITAIFLITSFSPISADEPTRQSLLTIERSKNANIVQYDVQVDRDGLLNADEPVIAYWIRHAEQGQVEELNWTQMKFAYGFIVDLADDRTAAELELKVDIGRPLIIRRHEGKYHAFLQIDDQPAVLDTVFVKSTGKGVSTRVPYIDLKGRTLDGTKPVEERIIP